MAGVKLENNSLLWSFFFDLFLAFADFFLALQGEKKGANKNENII